MVRRAADLLERVQAASEQFAWERFVDWRQMRAPGIATLADVTVRIPRWRQWWKAVPRLGPASARRVEVCLAAHLALTGWVRELVAVAQRHQVVDATAAAARRRRLGPHLQPAIGTLDKDDDYQAVHAWLSLHGSAATCLVRPCFRDLRSLEASTAKYPRRLRS
ncbi:phage integrase family protein [Burkholderia sp. A9]|uniref:phage integrase family protein n=1 Tax=Burkholderia sp. A9 TaxID=1365108 RepID=UPI003FA4AD1E